MCGGLGMDLLIYSVRGMAVADGASLVPNDDSALYLDSGECVGKKTEAMV